MGIVLGRVFSVNEILKYQAEIKQYYFSNEIPLNKPDTYH